MALSRRQLRAIFAKMAAWKKSGRSRISRAQPRARAPMVGLTQKDVPKLLKRLPRKHREMSTARKVIVHTGGESLRKAFRKLDIFSANAPPGTVGFYLKRTINVRGDVAPYLRNVGYGVRPAHISRVKPGGNFDRRLRRNAKVGSRSAFYHEYAHSVDNLTRFSGVGSWRRLRKEWLGVDDMTESWCEAYSMFARSKVSRARLRRERPKSYQYMKAFFEQ